MSNILRLISILVLVISAYFYWDLFTINKIIFTASISFVVIIVAAVTFLTKSDETSSFVSISDRIELLAVIVVTNLGLAVISAASVLAI